MTQYTYAVLLKDIGLTNFQFISLLLLGLFLVSIVYFLFKIGSLSKVVFEQKRMPNIDVIYISYADSYDRIGQAYDQVNQQFMTVFKFSTLFAIYYDNPTNQPQQGNINSKAIIGIMVSEIQNKKISLFLQNYPNYKQSKFPSTKCLVSQYPLINSLSSILVLGRVYPKIEDQLKKRGFSMNKNEGIVEIYHTDKKNPTIDVIIPVQNKEAFQIWRKDNVLKINNKKSC